MTYQKKIHLITLAAFPYSSAESVHLAMFSKALATLCDFTLVTPAKIWRPVTFFKALEKTYGIGNHIFKQEKFLQISPEGNCFIYQALRSAKRDLATVYARQAIIARKAIAMRLPIVWEIHALPNSADLAYISATLDDPYFEKIVVISSALKVDIVRLAELTPDQAKKIIVAPDAADESKFVASPLNLENPRIGYVGSSFRGKGIEVIVPLAKVLPELSFEVFGVGTDDEPLREYKPLPSNITWHGKISYADVPAAIASFDIALLPNQPNIIISDGTDIGKYTSPMKLFEYMAAGRTIVASDLPIIREILNESNAILVPHNDIDRWAERIRQLVGSTGLLRNLAEKAHIDFIQRHTYLGRANSILRNI